MTRWLALLCVLALLGLAPEVRAEDADIPALVKQLESLDSSKAAERLVALGVAAVPELERALMATSVHLRLQATEVLGRMGPQAVAATDALIENLVDDHQPLVAASARALGRLRTERGIAVLRELAADAERPHHRMSAYQGLALAGPDGARGLRASLRRGFARRAEVYQALKALGDESLPACLALLSDPSWHIRRWSIQASPPVQGMSEAWVDALAAAGRDESSAVAFAAARRLAHSDDDRVVPHLVRFLSAPHVRVRREAAFGLSRFGRLDATVVSALVTAILEPDAHLRRNAAWALGGAPELASIEAALRPLLGEREYEVWFAAAGSLVRRGYRGADAMPALIAAVRTYGGIAAPFDLHLRGLRDLGTAGGGRTKFGGPASQVRLSTVPICILDVGGSHAALLEDAVAETEGWRRIQFVFALGRIGDPGFAPLVRLTACEDLSVRMCAACCLARFGARGKVAVPLLLPVAARHERGDPVLVRAGEGLVAPGPLEEEVLVWPSTSWILESREALVAIGPAALEALQDAADKDPAIALKLDLVIAAIRKKAGLSVPK